MKKVTTALALACISVVLTGILTLQSSAQIDPGSIAGMWLFDEGQGDIAGDSSGNGNDGAIMGPVWVDGEIGKALQFDGSDDYVDCGDDPSLDLTDQITLVAWMKHPPGTEGYTIIRNSPDDSIRQWGLLDYTSTGNVSLFCNTGAGREQLDWAGTLDDDTWHHVALTIDNPNVELFVDGVSRGVLQLSDQIVSTDTTVWIGRRKPSNFPYTGLIDEVAVFSVVLSESDVNNVMAGLSGVTTAVSPVGKLATSWSIIKTQN
jgi:hypothetical protein